MDADIRLWILHLNNVLDIDAKYEILEDKSVNDLIEVDRKIIWMRDYLLNLKINWVMVFATVEKGVENMKKILSLFLLLK